MLVVADFGGVHNPFPNCKSSSVLEVVAVSSVANAVIGSSSVVATASSVIKSRRFMDISPFCCCCDSTGSSWFENDKSLD